MPKLYTDILIVTATKVESKYVLSTFRQAEKFTAQPRDIDNRIFFDLGAINGVRVFLVQSEIGAGGLGASLQTVQKGIEALSPSAVIMTGIAFGIDENSQHIGDILIAQQIRPYEPQRVGTPPNQRERILRGDKPHVSPWLLNRMKMADLSWEGPRVQFGVILTGEKLIDNQIFRDSLLEYEPEAIGGEMEGAGLYAACQDKKVDWILVKAICDWANGNKTQDKENRQILAAKSAADFVLHSVKFAPFRIPTNPNQPEEIVLGKIPSEEIKIRRLPDEIPADELAENAKRLAVKLQSESTGIIAVYENLDMCAQDMQNEFEKAKNVRLLLQIGRRELGDGKSSLFWSGSKLKTKPDEKIQVLRASAKSPFLSEERARKRGGTTVTRWRKHLQDLHDEIVYLHDDCHVQIEEEEHCEPFLWRIFLFDDIAYVSGYIFRREVDSKCVVYKFRQGGNSLYSVFDKYFRYLWLKYSPTSIKKDEIELWQDFE